MRACCVYYGNLFIGLRNIIIAKYGTSTYVNSYKCGVKLLNIHVIVSIWIESSEYMSGGNIARSGHLKKKKLTILTVIAYKKLVNFAN